MKSGFLNHQGCQFKCFKIILKMLKFAWTKESSEIVRLYPIFFFLVSGWFRAILPKSALRVEEEAWNAYPYTKTIYRCPFIEKFTLEIETKYQSDGGEQDNIFDLSKAELRTRTIGTYSQQEIEFHLVLLNISKTKNVVTLCIEDI